MEEDEYDIEDLDAFYQKLYGEIAAMLKDAIAAKEYGEEKTINLTVSKNEDGLYDVEEDGLTELAENLFSTDIEDMYSDLDNEPHGKKPAHGGIFSGIALRGYAGA